MHFSLLYYFGLLCNLKCRYWSTYHLFAESAPNLIAKCVSVQSFCNLSFEHSHLLSLAGVVCKSRILHWSDVFLQSLMHSIFDLIFDAISDQFWHKFKPISFFLVFTLKSLQQWVTIYGMSYPCQKCGILFFIVTRRKTSRFEESFRNVNDAMKLTEYNIFWEINTICNE